MKHGLIVLVEDIESQRKSMKVALRHRNFEVEVAGDVANRRARPAPRRASPAECKSLTPLRGRTTGRNWGRGCATLGAGSGSRRPSLGWCLVPGV